MTTRNWSETDQICISAMQTTKGDCPPELVGDQPPSPHITPVI